MYNGRKLALFNDENKLYNYNELNGENSQNEIDNLDDSPEYKKNTIEKLKFLVNNGPDIIWYRLIQDDEYSFDDIIIMAKKNKF